jgi:hypothetical protein
MINGPSSSLVCADEKDFLLGIKLYPADKHDKRKLLNNQSTQHTDSYSISGLNKSGVPNAFILRTISNLEKKRKNRMTW